MKKILIALMAVAVTLSSCSSVFGLSGASTGAMVGGTLGSILGNSTGRYGSTIGGLVGTMAGAAVGNAIQKKTTEQQINRALGNSYAQQSGTNTPSISSVSLNTSSVRLENFHFVDENNDQVINRNEECKVMFDVVNGGSTTVRNVTPVLELAEKAKGILLGGATTIESIPAGGKVTYSVPLIAKNVKNGEAIFQAYATEANGAVTETIEFSLQTRK